MYPPSIQKLIDLFSKFPTVGPRTAARFVFYLMKLSKEEINELIKSISGLREKVRLCSFCFKPFEPSFADSASVAKATSAKEAATEGNGQLCEICRDPSRDKTLLCIVEKETDLIALEKTKKYQGRYFILGGREEIKNLRTNELLERVKNSEIKEVIIAVNPTTEGEVTALYLERLLKPLGKKSTRLGRGLPVGGELEYADEETLSSALDNRK